MDQGTDAEEVCHTSTLARAESKDRPPKMSELRIVLLGKSGMGKSSCGNTILGRDAFQTRSSPAFAPVNQQCSVATGKKRVRGKRLLVIDTPDLFDSHLTYDQVHKQITDIKHLTSPGPHVLLLVIQPSRLGIEGVVLKMIEEAFGDRALAFTIAIFTHVDNEEERSFIDLPVSKNLQGLLSNRYHLLNNTDKDDHHQVNSLLDKINKMVEENACLCNPKTETEDDSLARHVSKYVSITRPDPVGETVGQKGDRPRDEQKAPEPRPTPKPRVRVSTAQGKGQNVVKESVRLVLLGKTGVGKSATGNTILGRREFQSSSMQHSATTNCEKKSTVIGAREVQVIDTPGLSNSTLTPEKACEEIGKCISFASPGPHVFLLLLSVGRFTQEEREAVEMIQEIFGERANKYTIVGFTRGDNLEDGDIEGYIQKGNAKLRELIQDCGGRYHIFNNKDINNQHQVSSLLEKIDKMIHQNGGRFYTTRIYEEIEKNIKTREIRLREMSQQPLLQQSTTQYSSLENSVPDKEGMGIYATPDGLVIRFQAEMAQAVETAKVVEEQIQSGNAKKTQIFCKIA